MFKLDKILEKLKKKPNISEENNVQPSQVKGQNSIKQIRNWYEERFENITVQRNLLFVLLLVLLLLSIISVSVVAYVVNAKRFDPFVIQIDDTTGMAKIVNPINSSVLSSNEALAQYFIKKYVIARETYNPVDFETEAMKTVRLLSSSSIYWSYRGYLKNNEVNPTTKYGQKNTTFFILKSWSKLGEKKFILRFSINETAGARKVFNKIAVIEFDYLPMELTDNDRDINPIGFQVIGYRVDDDNS
jgi:type IV secretion system protein VirB8